MVWLFWVSVAFVAYTYVGYPMVLWVVSLVKARPHRRGTIRPMLSLIIVAHNESLRIREKITNTLALRYPEDLWEIIIVTDGCDDGTPDIVRSVDAASPNIKLLELPERCGKHYGQMAARDISSGEILVFTDASVFLDPESLQKVVMNFADPLVGCVSSEDEVVIKGKCYRGERTYVGYEVRVRRLESRINSLVGVSGSYFAARREVCREWHTDQSSDFFIPLHTAKQGLRSVVDPECVGRYTLVRAAKDELPRKVRTIVHGLEVFFSHLELLNLFRYGLFSLELISHKLFRWLVPCALVCLLASNVLLWRSGLFYRVFLVGQVAFYAVGSLGQVSSLRTRLKPFKLATFFSMTNWAILVGWFKFMTGERYVTWRPSQRA